MFMYNVLELELEPSQVQLVVHFICSVYVEYTTQHNCIHFILLVYEPANMLFCEHFTVYQSLKLSRDICFTFLLKKVQSLSSVLIQ